MDASTHQIRSPHEAGKSNTSSPSGCALGLVSVEDFRERTDSKREGKKQDTNKRTSC